MSTIKDLDQAVADSKYAADVMKQFAKGDENTQVDNGLPGGIPSLAKFYAQNQQTFDDSLGNLIDDAIAGATTAESNAVAAKELAQTAATQAQGSATAAAVSASEALESKDAAELASQFAQAAEQGVGPILGFYATKSALNSALAGLADGFYEVIADEGNDGVRTRYKIESNVATYLFDVNSAAGMRTVDALNLYTDKTVEGALQEVGIALRLPDVAAARALNQAIKGNITILGQDGGVFYRDSSDTTSAEDGSTWCGTIIRSADYATRGVWKRKFTGAVAVEWFGADPTGLNYCALNINLALASIWPVVALQVGGTYKLETDLHVHTKTIFEGNGAKLVSDQDINFMARNHALDQPDYGGGSNIVFRNIIFDGGNALQLRGGIGLGHTQNTLVDRCVFQNFIVTEFHAIDSSGNQGLTVRDCLFQDYSGATTLQIDAASVGSLPTLTPPYLETASNTKSKDILVTGNQFIRCGGTTDQAIHLHKKGHSRITITNNKFIDCFRAVADDLGSTYRSNGPTTDILISGNTVTTDKTGGGIFLDYVLRAIVCDNIISGTGGGIQVITYDASQKNITGITKASPGVVTSVAHGYSNGYIIKITAVGGMTQLNNRYYTVAGVTTDTYTLIDLGTGAAVDTSGYSTYTSGGVSTYKTFGSNSRNQDVKIARNVITSTNSDAILVDNCLDATVIDNTINEYGEYADWRAGIGFDQVFPLTCRDNTIASLTSGNRYGVSVRRSYNYKVLGNTIDRGAYAIYVEKLDRSEVDRGIISGNICILGTTYPIYLKGNSVHGMSNIVVSDNLINGQFGGIPLRAEYVTGIVVQGNNIEQVANSAAGVSLNLCANAAVQGNVITAQSGSTKEGVTVFGSGSSGRASVNGNVISTFSTAVTISGSGADYGTVVGNTFIGITGTVTVTAANVVVANNCIV